MALYTLPEAPAPQQNNVFARLNSAIDLYQQNYKTEQLQKQKDMQRKMDMYKTLRDSGYDPSSAYDAVNKNALPAAAPDLSLKDQKDTATVQSIQAATDLKKAQTVKTNTQALTPSQATLTSRILNKIANKNPLTVGEQKVYDEVIRKYGNKSNLDQALGNAPEGDQGGADINAVPDTAITDYVKMSTPQGKPKKVHPDDVQNALDAGWKKR